MNSKILELKNLLITMPTVVLPILLFFRSICWALAQVKSDLGSFTSLLSSVRTGTFWKYCIVMGDNSNHLLFFVNRMELTILTISACIFRYYISMSLPWFGQAYSIQDIKGLIIHALYLFH